MKNSFKAALLIAAAVLLQQSVSAQSPAGTWQLYPAQAVATHPRCSNQLMRMARAISNQTAKALFC
jgi:hypothetical protein